MTVCGRIIYSKETAAQLVADLYERFDWTIESSNAIYTVEEILVEAGFLTWEECEEAELSVY